MRIVEIMIGIFWELVKIFEKILDLKVVEFGGDYRWVKLDFDIIWIICGISKNCVKVKMYTRK